MIGSTLIPFVPCNNPFSLSLVLFMLYALPQVVIGLDVL
jgi:hypothetical protein